MIIVVSNDKRIPLDLVDSGVQIEQWSTEKFIEEAGSDEGLDIDEALYYDASVLTDIIYESLEAFIDYGISIVYYRFDDRPEPPFKMGRNVTVYKVKQPEPDPEPVYEPEPEPVYSAPEPEPVYQPEPEPDPEPVYTAPQPTYEPEPDPEPVYEAPIPEPQPVYQAPLDLHKDPEPEPEPVYEAPKPVYEAPKAPYSAPKQNTYTASYEDEKPVRNNSKKPDRQIDKITELNLNNMLLNDDWDVEKRRKKKTPAKVILFGSSKGGTGKTFTCLSSAYWYAKKHPKEKIALADFDIIDGQIGITINKLAPTMQDYYKLWVAGKKDFNYLDNCKVKSDNFSPNIDFYLAPSQDIPAVTNNINFWNELFESLINNYDVVFFDSGIDYLGKPPISQLYKIADRIIITTNPSINSVKSVIKQFKTLSGARQNPVFKPSDKILKRTNIVITRLYEEEAINSIVTNNLQKFSPIVAKFGNIDKVISEIQWYQHWDLIDKNPKIYEQLENIADLRNVGNDDEE